MNPYEILGVPQDAFIQEIRTAYRRLAMRHHPDRLVGVSMDERHQAVVKFQNIAKAWETLSDPEKRAALDSQLTGIRPVVLSEEKLAERHAASDDGQCSVCAGERQVRVSLGRGMWVRQPCPKCKGEPK